jgi:hypothetical protein
MTGTFIQAVSTLVNLNGKVRFRKDKGEIQFNLGVRYPAACISCYYIPNLPIGRVVVI